MRRLSSERRGSPARVIALVGIMAASVECGKLALMFLPNIEVVTILLALYGYVFGIYGVIASLVFVSCEPLLFGFGTWVISYFLYWPFVSFVFMLLGRAKIKNRFLICGIAVCLTTWFGVLSSLVDIGLFSGFFDNFFERFSIYYLRGIPFYLAQILTNASLFLFTFNYFGKKMEGLKKSFI